MNTTVVAALCVFSQQLHLGRKTNTCFHARTSSLNIDVVGVVPGSMGQLGAPRRPSRRQQKEQIQWKVRTMARLL